MARVAFHTYGILVADWDDPVVSGFVERIPAAYASADNSVGFIDRARRLSGISDSNTSWGQIEYPAFVEEQQRSRVLATCSLWQDLESVYAFAYAGVHGESMKHRKSWVVENGLSTYVAWWVEDSHQPDFAEAASRLLHLHDNGSTHYAFTFRQPFDLKGQPTTIDLGIVKDHIAVNSREG